MIKIVLQKAMDRIETVAAAEEMVPPVRGERIPILQDLVDVINACIQFLVEIEQICIGHIYTKVKTSFEKSQAPG